MITRRNFLKLAATVAVAPVVVIPRKTGPHVGTNPRLYIGGEEMLVDTSTGSYLDRWGFLIGLERKPGEPDYYFRLRVLEATRWHHGQT